MFDYSSRPWHVIFPLGLFALGSVAVGWGDGWSLFGVFCYIVAVSVTGWIVYAGMCDAYARYVSSLPEKLDDDHPVEPVQNLRVDLYEGSSSRHFDLPVSSVKLQPLAQGLLNGRPFSERTWSELFSSSEFRALRQALRAKELIEPVSDKDPRQGFRLTPSGRELMTSLLPHPIDV